LPHWDVRAYIVKHGDLVLQEQFVMQLLVQFQHIWELEGLPLKLQCYNIMATSYQSGLIEVVPNSISLDKLKKVTETNGSSLSLFEFFKKHWPTSEDFKRARSNFISSLAAYSVVCYLLQIKDRHNGNIMLDADGCLFHIDFGYLLARTIKFEKAPFKLTDEFIEVLGGDQSKSFRTYCNLVVLGFLAVRKHYEKIQLLVEMSAGEGAAIPCLEGDTVAPNLRKRFHLDWNEVQCEEYILGLIGEARDNWRTQIYDTYQRIVNDIH
jgi:phosphatidylinositol 4-kinase